MVTKKVGHPVVYQSAEERPITVSVRLPRVLAEQARRYARRHQTTLSALLLDGLQLRLDTPADPRDLIVSDDNTVIQELQEMIRAAVEKEVSKVTAFLGRQGSAPEAVPPPTAPAEPLPQLWHNGHTVIQQEGAQVPVDPERPPEPATLSDTQEAKPPRRAARRDLREPILALVHQHEGGLTARQIQDSLQVEQSLGDILHAMVKDGLLARPGRGPGSRYRAVVAPSDPQEARPSPRQRPTAQLA